MKKVRISKNRIYSMIGVVLLLITLLLSVFRFRPVFERTLQSFKDVGTSIGYYFTELLGFENAVTPTVITIPKNAIEVLPFEPEVFRSCLKRFGNLLIDKENFLSFLSKITGDIARFAQVFMLVLPIFILLFFLLGNSYNTPNNRYNTDTKPLRVYKKIEAVTWNKIKYYMKNFIAFLNNHRLYPIIGGFLWAYNLNVITVFLEAIAYVFYFSASFDFLRIYTQIAKLAMDLTVAMDFLPWWIWAIIGFVVFDAVRKRIGRTMLQHCESVNRTFLNTYPGALFLVGKQRAKKTTIITDMALSQEVIFREEAKERLFARDMQFPHFPWINVEILYRNSLRNKSLPTLAKCRCLIKFVRNCFEHTERGEYDKATVRGILRHLKKRYGYVWNDFIFGYDYNRYGLEFNDSLKIVNVFEAIENYLQLYFIYAAPTSLLFGNYAVRTDLERLDYGNFPIFDSNFFIRKAEETGDISRYSHILDFDMLRLGKVFNEKNPNKDAFEVGCVSVTEMAKERGNQNTNQGTKADAPECNQKNDLFEINTKMQGHNSTIDNYTFFRLLLDDQRADSLSADNRDLCDIILIKGVSEAKIVMPFFAIGEAAYMAAKNIFDKLYYGMRNLRGDNTLCVYLLKKLYGAINNHYLRIYNEYSVYTAKLKIWDAMSEDELTDRGKYYICTKKTYSDRFATDAIKEFYNAKALRSDRGLNDLAEYNGIHMTVEEMESAHSLFYSKIGRIFFDKKK